MNNLKHNTKNKTILLKKISSDIYKILRKLKKNTIRNLKYWRNDILNNLMNSMSNLNNNDKKLHNCKMTFNHY